MNVVQTRPQDPLGFQWELRELSSVIDHFHIDHNVPCLPSNILNGTTVIPRRNWEQWFWKILGAKQGALLCISVLSIVRPLFTWGVGNFQSSGLRENGEMQFWRLRRRLERRSDFHTGTSSSQFLLAMNSFPPRYHHKPHGGTVLTSGIVGLIISNHGMVPLKYRATSSCFILKQVFPENWNL